MTKNAIDKNSPEYLHKQLAGGRNNLLLVIVFTVVNLAMLLLDSGTYFLFSASVPYYMTAFGMGMDMGMAEAGIGTFTLIALGISAVVLVFYLLCWLLSKKRPGWLVVAFVAFILDTLALLGLSVMLEMLTDNIMDLAFHVWVVVSLMQGIIANGKLKKLPAEEPQEPIGPEF
jgi:hypothetical protein